MKKSFNQFRPGFLVMLGVSDERFQWQLQFLRQRFKRSQRNGAQSAFNLAEQADRNAATLRDLLQWPSERFPAVAHLLSQPEVDHGVDALRRKRRRCGRSLPWLGLFGCDVGRGGRWLTHVFMCIVLNFYLCVIFTKQLLRQSRQAWLDVH